VVRDTNPRGDTISCVRRSLAVDTRTASLARVREFVRETVIEAGVQPAEQARIVLAVDEAVSSIIIEAAGARGEGRIQVHLDIDQVRFRASIQDSTTVYEPELPLPDLACGPAAGEHGRELGVFLMRQLCDEIDYSYRRGYQNVLELVRFLG
jgi:anti-sigma regulatory factor (Ser/Thr protein kinase)